MSSSMPALWPRDLAGMQAHPRPGQKKREDSWSIRRQTIGVAMFPPSDTTSICCVGDARTRLRLSKSPLRLRWSSAKESHLGNRERRRIPQQKHCAASLPLSASAHHDGGQVRDGEGTKWLDFPSVLGAAFLRTPHLQAARLRCHLRARKQVGASVGAGLLCGRGCDHKSHRCPRVFFEFSNFGWVFKFWMSSSVPVWCWCLSPFWSFGTCCGPLSFSLVPYLRIPGQPLWKCCVNYGVLPLFWHGAAGWTNVARKSGCSRSPAQLWLLSPWLLQLLQVAGNVEPLFLEILEARLEQLVLFSSQSSSFLQQEYSAKNGTPADVGWMLTVEVEVILWRRYSMCGEKHQYHICDAD